MPRPFVFPDPNDRSKNDPNEIVTSKQVLGLFNQFHDEEEQMQRITDKVKEWFKQKAKDEGWDEADLSGGQCILKNNFSS